MMIRRLIATWIYGTPLAVCPDWRARRDALIAAQRQHKPTAHLQRALKARVNQALAGSGGR